MFLLFALLLLTGCQTRMQSLFIASGPGWHVQQGQALWRPRPRYPEIAGDLLVASDGQGRCLVLFEKTPLTMVTAQVTPDKWLIQFPQGEMSFAGHGSKPTRFSWLYLHAALSGETLPKQLHFENKPGGGWRLENTVTGESVDGFLSP